MRKNIWTDRAKSTTAAQPLVGDANGVASAFFDGLYKLVVMNSAETETLFTWDNFQAAETELRLEGSTTWNPEALLPGQSGVSPGITITGAAFGQYVDVAAPYDLQGMRASAHVSATNTVKIVLERPLAMLTGSGTWDPASLADGAGETSPNITVTGATLNDAVLVYPPYNLQGVLCTGYVSATNAVNIRVQNETGGVLDLASGTWQVAVVPKGTAIDVAPGSWGVRIRQ
jgi:hypothetical protein